MGQKKAVLSRRNFLLTVGAGGAYATVALVSKDGTQSSKRAGVTSESKGYRLTEHVQKYYNTTKV